MIPHAQRPSQHCSGVPAGLPGTGHERGEPQCDRSRFGAKRSSSNDFARTSSEFVSSCLSAAASVKWWRRSRPWPMTRAGHRVSPACWDAVRTVRPGPHARRRLPPPGPETLDRGRCRDRARPPAGGPVSASGSRSACRGAGSPVSRPSTVSKRFLDGMESLDERIGSPLQATHSGIDDPPALVIARGGELAQGHDHTHPMWSVPP